MTRYVERRRELLLMDGRSSLCCLFVFPSSFALVNGCALWSQPGAWEACECRGCYGTDDWKRNADGLLTQAVCEVVSRGLEVQRQVDEILAVQCRKYALAVISSVLRALRMLWHIVLKKSEQIAVVLSLSMVSEGNKLVMLGLETENQLISGVDTVLHWGPVCTRKF